jgi:hypothetical protein
LLSKIVGAVSTDYDTLREFPGLPKCNMFSGNRAGLSPSQSSSSAWGVAASALAAAFIIIIIARSIHFPGREGSDVDVRIAASPAGRRRFSAAPESLLLTNRTGKLAPMPWH